ncbi:hypothetical protein D3C71_445550 [compost metagenome]
MYMSLNRSRFLVKHLVVGTMMCLTLSACDINHTSSKDHSSANSKNEENLIKSSTTIKTLDDVAGRTFLPEENLDQTKKLSGISLQYVGRYHTRISCEDAFADCESGEAEYILNLLPNGSAYWNVIHFGRVGSKDGAKSTAINQLCPDLNWKVDEREHELTIHCPLSNVNFYFTIDSKKRLIVNLEKLFYSDYGKNREFLEQNYFVPKQAYVLTKE